MFYKLLRYEQIKTIPHLLQWLVLASLVGAIAGSASALFLATLDLATNWRETHPLIILALPVAGMAIGLIYHYYGKDVESGNNLLIDEIHDPKKVIPLRMAPFVLLGTIGTHLFGGSAGREGTAVQMGGALADQLTHLFKLKDEDRRILIMAGISAGFASVFGTPLAGAIFGLEVLAIGKLRYDALFPCFIAAIVADQVTLLWGIHHTHYAIPFIPALSQLNIVYSIIAGIAFGVVGMLFANSTHKLSAIFKKHIPYAPLRPFVGGIIVSAAVLAIGTTKYIGLGIPTIVESFSQPLPAWDFAGKFIFTVTTLGAGFKGGEVTPLFYIGATLGNALSYVLNLPTPLLAGLGFVAVFAGAANTPLASTIMAIELFGGEVGSYAAIACVTSYLFSGHTGIYRSQQIGSSKHKFRIGIEGLKLAEYSNVIKLPIRKELHEFNSNRFPILTTKQELPSMSNVTALRLYFPLNAKVPNLNFWQKMTSSQLGHHLIKKAKEHGVEQAILHKVTGGFLKGDNPAYFDAEISSPKLPQCLELIDTDEKLHAFVETHKIILKDVKVVMLKNAMLIDAENNDNKVAA